MATLPQGWKQGNKPNIYEANIKPINVSTGTVYTVAETNKSTGDYTIYTTSGINFIGGRTPLYTVSSSGARTVQNQAVYNQLQQSGEIAKLDTSIKPKAFEINQSFGTEQEKQAVANSTLYKSQANAASSTSSGDPQSGDTEAKPDELQGGLSEWTNIRGSIKDNAKTRPVTAYGNLKYPLNLKSEDQDCIKFTMLSYSPRPLSVSGIAQGNPFGARTPMNQRDGKTVKTDGGTVTLPIQPSITDSNVVQWNSADLNAGEAIAATAALSGIKGGAEGLKASIKSGTDLLKNANPELKAAISAYFAQEAAGVKGLLTRTTGAIVNPNMELLFEGPQLRNFTFSFTMSAREPKEADEIKKIIRFFKQGMSVKRAATGLFLKTPHTFRIAYLHKNKEHPWINKIKECALTGCNVNYTPAGNYATYYDGSMTSYEISLSFGELEPIYDDDYAELVPGGNSDTHIGF